MLERSTVAFGVFFLLLGIFWSHYLFIAIGGAMVAYGLLAVVEILLIGHAVHKDDTKATIDTISQVVAEIYAMMIPHIGVLPEDEEPEEEKQEPSLHDGGSVTLCGGDGGKKDG